LQGAGVYVDIFNADDRLHNTYNPGVLTISDNTIALKERDDSILGNFVFFGPPFVSNIGIRLWETKEVQTVVSGNTLSWTPTDHSGDPTWIVKQQTNQWFGRSGPPIAIQIDNARNANYTITDNTATGFQYGAYGVTMDDKAFWTVT